MPKALKPKAALALKAHTFAKFKEGHERIVFKGELLDRLGVSYVTVWSWMRRGDFPRCRIVGGQTAWLASELDEWMANLPIRPLKGDK